jgi:succinyl-CoA synthetase beta subunit
VEDATTALRKGGLTVDSLLLGVDVLDFLAKEGFSILRSVLVQDIHEAVAVAASIGFPVTLKISSSHAIHKTDIGGVKTHLASKEAVAQAHRVLLENLQLHWPGARPEGIIIQKQGHGFEIIVGTLTDPQFGPIIMAGLGGIFAEALNDVSFRLIPIEPHDARSMLEDLRGYELLKGARGQVIDLAAVERFLVSVSDCLTKHHDIMEMDLNPAFVSERGVEICDARIKIDSHGLAPVAFERQSSNY